MTRMMKFVPWVVSVICLVALLAAWQDFRLKLEQKDVELSNLRQQHNNMVAEVNAKIEEANNKYKQLVDDANSKIQLASQREVQVRVSFRGAIFSSGNVAGITNLSNQPIAIAADAERPSSGQKRRFEMVINPGHAKEIGEVEGWAFIPGDTVTVSQPDHKPLTFTAP